MTTTFDATSPLPAIAGIAAAMALVAALEAWIPLHARGRWRRAHLAPNLALAALTLASNALLGSALLAALAWVRARGFAPLDALGLPPLASAAIALLALDFSFYLAHVAMHRIPSWWRVHRVHHSDPFVDVTTTLRQHPLEAGIRFAFTAACALALAPSPVVFAFYRVAVAVNALLEHADLRCPRRLDRALSWVTTWPHTHKIHHSREVAYTDTNYGNLFSWWDRLFGTFTPSHGGVDVAYGVDGLDDRRDQTTRGLLAMPWRKSPSPHEAGDARAERAAPAANRQAAC